MNWWRDMNILKGKSRDFVDGVKEGIRAYAWWKGGIAYVGTTGETLREALNEIDEQCKLLGIEKGEKDQ